MLLQVSRCASKAASPTTGDEKALNMWWRTCSPGDPAPQRQCALLLSTYLKEGEAKDGEEKASEVDGEVEERVTQRVHET